MGMYDQSWCSSCGTGLPYSADEVQCEECVSDQFNINSNKLIEYMKLYLISLEQDLEKLQVEMDSIDIGSKAFGELDIEYNWVSGQISATHDLLSVAKDILEKTH